MAGKQIFFIVAGVVVAVFGARYLSDATELTEECLAEEREPLPFCAEQKRIGSNVTVLNNCDYAITVHWEVNGGSDLINDLAPGSEKQVASYPLKINTVSCCPQTNRCF
ncbi:MAG: hypothetical protein QNI91_16855 [Arenicellales bacterium]|nr:hypothetical protein [Arenicellales bacterium]